MVTKVTEIEAINMTNGKGTAVVIAALVVGAAGLGVGTFSVIRYELVEGPQGLPGLDGIDGVNGTDGNDGINGTDGIDGVNGTDCNNLVAVWESLTGTGTNFLITLDDIKINQSDFFSLIASNTSVILTRVGWYRFSIRALWSGLSSSSWYRLQIEKNGGSWETIHYVQDPQATNYYIDTFTYVLSDGDDQFRFRCDTSGPGFQILSGQVYNQMILEYVGEP